MAQSTLERPDVAVPSIAHACEPATTPSLPTDTPVGSGKGQQRLTGIDAARGLALVGMMLVHILPFYTADGDLSAHWPWTAGKAAALFAVVAGVGLAMTTGRPERLVGRRYAAASASLVVRALVIGALGLLLGVVVPSAIALVILPYYAALFVLAIPLIRLSRRWLVALTRGVAVVAPWLSHLWRDDMTEGLFNPTFSTVLTDPGSVFSLLMVTGSYPALAWVAYICAGLAVGRCTLRLRSTAAGVMVLGVALAAGTQALSWLLMQQAGGRAAIDSAAAADSMSATEVDDLLSAGGSGTLPTNTAWWLATDAPHSSTPVDLLFTIGVALAVLGAMILLARAAGGALRPLTAVGSMPLTMYATHLLLLAQPWMPEAPMLELAIQLVALTTLAMVWSAYFSRGPLEQVVRYLAMAAAQRVSTGGSPGHGSGTQSRGRHRAGRTPVEVV